MNATPAPAITGTTRIYCIIGHPVAPVRSPAFYNALFRASAMDAVFVAIDIAAKDAARGFEGLRAMANVAGIVVTMPLKQLVLPLVDEVLPRARQVGAVNTIRREADGRLVGDMFDGRGGVLGLRWEGHEPRGRRVLLVGAGGAGSALAFALAEAGVAQADPAGHDIVVNATPLGMKPGDPMPVDPERLAPGTVVFDIITNPDPSALMLAARARGCPAIGGRHLYEGQAFFAARFLGIPFVPEGRPEVELP